jgi:hypothetical protein
LFARLSHKTDEYQAIDTAQHQDDTTLSDQTTRSVMIVQLEDGSQGEAAVEIVRVRAGSN